MNRVYIDTSAYLAVLLGETGHAKISRSLRGAELCSSTLLVIEADRALVRLSRSGILSAEQWSKAIQRLRGDLEAFTFRDLTLDLCLAGSYPPVRTPRSSDLAHLRTSLWFKNNGGLKGFLTLDEAQQAVATDLGLQIVSL